MLETLPSARVPSPSLKPSVLYLLPTRSRVQQEVQQRSLADLRDGRAVLMGPALLTFPELVERLYRAVPQPRTMLTPLARTLLADSVVGSYLGNPIRHLQAQRAFRGFTAALLAWMDGLRRALVPPADYAATLQANPPLGCDIRQAVELAELYRQYLARLEQEGLIDSPGMEREVLDLLEGSSPIAALDGVRELRMEDFYDLTYLQFRIVLALTQRVQKAQVVFPYNTERQDAYRFVGEHTIRYFELLGEERVASAIDPCFKFEALRPGTALSFVLQHIFKPATVRRQLQRHAGDDSLKLLAAPGLTREVETMGRELRRLLADGVQPEAMAVVFRNLGHYGKIVEDVFTRYRIPFSFRRGSPLLSNPVVSLVLTVLELAMSQGDLDRDRVMQFLSSAYVRLAGTDPATFDIETATADIRSGPLSDWQAALNRLTPPPDPHPALQALGAFLQPLSAPRPLPDFTHALRHALLVQLRLRQNIQATGEAAVLARDLEALEQVEAVLADLDDAARTLSLTQPVSLEDFHRLLLGGLQAGSLPGHGAHRGGVRILNALDARGLAFDYVFIGGLAEGVWPQAPSPSPLFSDAEKALFRDGSGRRLFRSSRMAAWEDPLLFCLTLSMARQRATLSYPTADGRGQATLKSYFLEEVLELVETPLEATPHDQLVVPLEQAADPWELAIGLLQRHREAEAPPALQGDTWATRYPLLPGANARPLLPPLTHVWRAAALEKRRDRFFRTADPTRRAELAFGGVGRLDPQVQPLLKLRHWSVSDLELYANCPTAWFLKKGLGLSEVQRPQVEAPSNVVGQVAHDVMHEFYRRQKDSGHWLFGDERQARNALQEAADAVFARWEAQARPLGDRFFWALKKHEIVAGLRRVVDDICNRWEAEQLWTPMAFELPFEHVPVDVPGVGRITLRGQIDRVDVAPGSFRVVDYKWSRSPDKLHEITRPDTVGDTKFQLLVYLYVTEQSHPGAVGHGAIHLLRKPDLRSRAFEPVDAPAALSPLLLRAASGQFDTSPQDCPLTCPYRYVCRFYLPHEEPV